MSVTTDRLVAYRARLLEQRTELLDHQVRIGKDLAATAGAMQLADVLLAESQVADAALAAVDEAARPPDTQAEAPTVEPTPIRARKRATRRG